MKKTGVVRRIDNLGRIVVPKEIRNTLLIKEGDNLEIYVSDNDEIVFRKFSFINKLSSLALACCKSLSLITKGFVLIGDRTGIIAANGKNKSEYLSKGYFNDIINDMDKYTSVETLFISSLEENILITPIFSKGDKVGLIIFCGSLNEIDKIKDLCKMCSLILENYLE